MSALLSKSTEQVTAALEQATAALSTSDATRTVYVDESPSGSDSAGNGTQTAPYATVLGAYIGQGTSSLAVLVKKQSTADEPTPEYAEASASSVKKAKKNYDTHVKKLAKQEELNKKQSEESAGRAEVEAKKLQEAKAIVLSEPEGVEAATKIKLRHSVDSRGKRVKIMGWVHRLRQQGGLTFLVLRDGTGYLQCVLSGNLVSTAVTSYASG